MNAAYCIGGQNKKKIYLTTIETTCGAIVRAAIVRLKGDKNIPAALREYIKSTT